MMNNKILIVFSLMIVLLGSVSAITWDNVNYYKFDTTTGNLVDFVGSSDLIEQGTVPSQTGIISNARGVYSDANYFRGTSSEFSVGTDIPFTVSFWVYGTPSSIGESLLVVESSDTTNDMHNYFSISTNNKAKVYSGYRTSTVVQLEHSNVIQSNTWTMLTYVYRADRKFDICVNSVCQTSGNAHNSGSDTDSNRIVFGNWWATGQPASHFRIDESGLWLRALSQDDINDLYNNGDGITYGEEIYVELISPENNFKTLSETINFQCSIGLPNVVNVSLLINDLVNITNTSGVNGIYNFTQNFSFGTYNWSCEVCSADSCYNATNRVFSSGGVVENSVTYDEVSYETATDTYIINVSSDGVKEVSATFNYNGTIYTATKTGDNYEMIFTSEVSHVVDDLGDKTFYWNFTYGGEQVISDSYDQTINPILLSLCNATNNIPFINFSFKDEETLDLINATIDASTWTYWLGDGTYTKELLFSNTSVNCNYVFCFSPGTETLHNTRSVQFSNGGYPQRAYDASSDLTNTTLNYTLYLLNSADGIYSTMQVIDGSERVVSGVEVTVERQFSGVWVVVGQSTTDSSGSATFWVNPDYDHRYTFTHDDCTTKTVTIRPTQTNYIVTLDCLGTSQETGIYTSPIEGLRYSSFPASGVISSGVSNFTYTLISTKENIVGIKFDIVDATDLSVLMTHNSTCTPSGCVIYKTYDVPVGARLKGRYYVDLGSGYILIEGDAAWINIDIPETDHGTLKDFFLNFNRMFVVSDSPDEDDRNKQEYSKFVFVFFLFAVVYSVFNKATGYDAANPGLIIFPLVALILMGSLAAGFDCANHGCQGMFYYYDYSGLDGEKLGQAAGFWNNYILSLITMCISGGYFLNTLKRNN